MWPSDVGTEQRADNARAGHGDHAPREYSRRAGNDRGTTQASGRNTQDDQESQRNRNDGGNQGGWGATNAASSGPTPPIAKLTEDVSAAMIGCGDEASEMPMSSRICAASAS